MSLFMIDAQALQYIMVPPENNATARNVQDWYLEMRKLKANIALSSIVLGEVLAGHPPEARLNLLKVLSHDWLIYPYDDVAAFTFAGLRYEHIHVYERSLMRTIQNQ